MTRGGTLSSAKTIIELTLPELPELPLPAGIPLPQQMEIMGYQISTMYLLILAAVLLLLILVLIVRSIRHRTRPVVSAAANTDISASPSVSPSKSGPKHMRK
jgi:hypothetical protein